MTTHTNEKIKNLTDKLIEEKIAHLATLLDFEYDLQITDVNIFNDRKLFLIIKSDAHEDVLVFSVSNIDEFIESDTEEEASRLFDSWFDCYKQASGAESFPYEDMNREEIATFMAELLNS